MREDECHGECPRPKIAKTVKPIPGQICYTLKEMSGPARKTTLRFYKECLLRVLVHIQQHLDEPMALEELARLACLSPHHFHHVFTGMLSESLGSHVRRLRLERAAWRLKLANDAVVRIAFEAGYETHEAFSRAFRKNFGLSPIQFRRGNSVSPRIQAPSGVHYQNRRRLRDFDAAPIQDQTTNVIIKNLKPMRVAFMRHVGPYNEVGRTWDQLMMFLGKEGLLNGGARFIGISPRRSRSVATGQNPLRRLRNRGQGFPGMR